MNSRSRKLRDRLHRALRKERLSEALQLYQTLEAVEPNEPRWPHRKGDLLQRLRRKQDAVDAYEHAVDLYANQGFVARAAAMAKVVIGIDASRSDVLERVSLDAARKLHRSARSRIVTADDELGGDEPVTQTKRITTDALPLIVDESAGEDQLRFTRPPSAKRASLELEITDAEIHDRPLTGPGVLSERPTAQHLAQLPSMPLFAEVSHSVLEQLVKESRLVDLEVGERLIEKGTTADALYTLIEGSVELRRTEDQEPVVLSEGDVVGISCLLAQVRYEADVIASTKVRAMRISKLLLDRLVSEHPALREVLLEILGRRLVTTLLQTSPMFAGFNDIARFKAARLFEVRCATEGTAILEAGKRSDGLYIPMLGQLAAKSPDGEEIGRLKLGRALGQHSVLTRAPSPLTVEALTDVLVLRMAADGFNALVAEHPKIVAHLEALARHPSQPTFSLFPDARAKA